MKLLDNSADLKNYNYIYNVINIFLNKKKMYIYIILNVEIRND